MIDEAAALAVILRELPKATPTTRLPWGARVDAAIACRDAFSLSLTTREMDVAMTPAEIAAVVARAAQDQFMA